MTNHGFRRLALAHDLLSPEIGPEFPMLDQSDLTASGDERQAAAEPSDGKPGCGTAEPIRR